MEIRSSKRPLTLRCTTTTFCCKLLLISTILLSSHTSNSFTIPLQQALVSTASIATYSTQRQQQQRQYFYRQQGTLTSKCYPFVLKMSPASQQQQDNDGDDGNDDNSIKNSIPNQNDKKKDMVSNSSNEDATNNNNISNAITDTNGNNNNNILSNTGIKMSQKQLEHEVKKYKAQAEINAILNDPDGAPFDLKSEIEKIAPGGGGIAPQIAPDSQESQIEERLHVLESQLYDAISKREFDKAQLKKEEVDKIHIDDCGFVLEKHSAFYKAFSNKDYDAMDEIWLHDNCAICIHPSQKPIIGASAVLTSWEKMFQSGIDDGNGGYQRNKIVPTNIRLCVKGTTATVTCDEEVYTRRFVRGKKRLEDNDGMELVNKLTATNILRKVGGKWYMMQHHASWHHESAAAKKAMNSQMTSSKDNISNKSGEFTGTVEGLLGIPGHEGLGGEKKKKEGERKGPVRRVFTGSLSDLLGGGLDDILKGDMDNVNNDDDDDDDDDDDNEEIIIANMMATGGPQGHIGIGSPPNIANGQGEQILDQSEKEWKRDKNESKDSIRQNCIATLRKLSSQGIISSKHKRMLLTDIITNSAKGEYSLVEVAYDLLCGEGDDKDAAEEDFAEQCQVFASSLPEIRI